MSFRSRLLKSFTTLIILPGWLNMAPAYNTEEEEALLELYGDEEMISIATGRTQPVSKAPAIASVITAREIKAMGAHDIDDILQTVPGLHVSYNTIIYNPIYTFRGIYSSDNPQVLMLINGISINNLFVGNRNQVWGGMPVESISRIEVIRGPGSALYGADAFAGVINIVTKQAAEISGTQVGLRYGSFNTKAGWLLHGKEYAGFDVALMAEFASTQGHHENVDSDAISASGASLTPGSTSNGRDNLDLRLDIERAHWQLRAGLQRRRNVEVGFGVGAALDTHARYQSDRWNADLTYYNPDISDTLDVQAQVSVFNTSQEVDKDTFLLPPGAPRAPPAGLIGNPEVWERHWRFGLTSQYSGIENHRLRVGAGYHTSDIYRVREENNFSGVLRDVSDTDAVFLPEKHRNNHYGFVQDIWNIANNWELTLGLRYDDYNDFGDTWNPRAALVWSATYNTTLKALYGQAFRAPSFAEFRNQNNPVVLGNSGLKPEKIEIFELALDTHIVDDIHLGANIFHYEWHDIIRFVPDAGSTTRTAQNIARQKGYGAEFEMEWKPSRRLSLLANYAYQYSQDRATRKNAGNAPHHQIYARAHWRFLPAWTLTPALNYVIDRKRLPLDRRDPLDDYALLNVTLRGTAFNNTWEFAAGVRNLLNASPEEPTPANFNIANDLPLARRSVFTEFRLNFQ